MERKSKSLLITMSSVLATAWEKMHRVRFDEHYWKPKHPGYRRLRGSVHPRLLPRGHAAKRKRFRLIQKASRRANRS